MDGGDDQRGDVRWQGLAKRVVLESAEVWTASLHVKGSPDVRTGMPVGRCLVLAPLLRKARSALPETTKEAVELRTNDW